MLRLSLYIDIFLFFFKIFHTHLIISNEKISNTTGVLTRDCIYYKTTQIYTLQLYKCMCGLVITRLILPGSFLVIKHTYFLNVFIFLNPSGRTMTQHLRWHYFLDACQEKLVWILAIIAQNVSHDNSKCCTMSIILRSK